MIYVIGQWLEGNAALKQMLGPDAALMIGAPLSAPLVEETAKGIGIVLLFWLMRSEYDNVRDGFVYGALVGAGFNWFESALYVQQNFVQFGDAPYGFQLGARYAWLGLAGHAMFSGIFGAALGLARATHSRLVRYCAPLVGFVAGRDRARVEQLAAAGVRDRVFPGRRGASDRERRAAGCRPARDHALRQHLEPGDLPAVRAAAGLDHPTQWRGGADRDPGGTRRRGGELHHERTSTTRSAPTGATGRGVSMPGTRLRPPRWSTRRTNWHSASGVSRTGDTTPNSILSWPGGGRRSRHCEPGSMPDAAGRDSSQLQP